MSRVPPPFLECTFTDGFWGKLSTSGSQWLRFWPDVSKDSLCHDWAQATEHSFCIRAEQSAWAIHLFTNSDSANGLLPVHPLSSYETGLLSWITSLKLFPDFWGPFYLPLSFYCPPPNFFFLFFLGVLLISPRGTSLFLLSPWFLSGSLAFELIVY